jgi:hypothetical protein
MQSFNYPEQYTKSPQKDFFRFPYYSHIIKK